MENKKESDIEKNLEDGSPVKKLIKLFRTNTVAKHHIQGAASNRPMGVAKAFFKNSLSYQSSVIPNHSNYDRFARYADYAEMLSYPILNQALQIFAAETTQKDENAKIITVTSDSKLVSETLQDLIDNVLQLNGKKIYKLARDLCKYGDCFYLIDITDNNGVVNLIHMPANEVEREEGFDKDEPTAVRFKWSTRNTQTEIPNAFIAHFRLDGDDLYYPYGQSVFEGARRPWRQLVLLEDAMMVYRITRSAERRVFYMDTMGIDPENVPLMVNEFNAELKKKKVVNEQGKIDLRYGATLDMTEDYIIPVRGEKSSTRIETLPGGQNIGDIEDVEFIKANLFAALGIPKAFLTFDEGVGSKQVLTQEDIRFSRTISKIQECIINELVKVCLIHLIIKGIRGKDLFSFKIKMTNPSTVAELQKNELWRARMDLVQSAGQGVFDTTFIYKNFLRLSDDVIDTIRKGQIQDKIFQAKLMAIENSGGSMNMGAGGMGGLAGGGMIGGMGGGLGAPMDMGMGGAPPNVSGTQMPPMGESMNPAANVVGTNTTPGKDLTRRNANERIKNLRGLPDDELISMGDLSDQPDEVYDMDGLQRQISSPMGAKENKQVNEFDLILENLRKISKDLPFFGGENNGYTVVDAKTIPLDPKLAEYIQENDKEEPLKAKMLVEAYDRDIIVNHFQSLDEELERLQEQVEKIEDI